LLVAGYALLDATVAAKDAAAKAAAESKTPAPAPQSSADSPYYTGLLDGKDVAGASPAAADSKGTPAPSATFSASRLPRKSAVVSGASGGGLVLFWSLKNPHWPQKIFRTRHGVASMDFCADRPNLLAVGLYDGTVAIYDVTKYFRPARARTAGRI
jgi:hypothetical protein